MPAPKKNRKTRKPKSMVAEVKAKLQARLKELNAEIDPRVAERDEIVTLLGEQKPKAAAPKPKKAEAGGRPTRQRKGGRREDEFVSVVKANPGIGVSDAAKQMKLKPNYLYRVAREAVARQKVVKEGKGYKVVA